MCLRICRGFKSAKNWFHKSEICKLQKIYGPQIAKPQIATFAEGQQIFKKFSPQIFRFAICETYFADRPPLELRQVGKLHICIRFPLQ
jgi:hypothetical protein